MIRYVASLHINPPDLSLSYSITSINNHSWPNAAQDIIIPTISDLPVRHHHHVLGGQEGVPGGGAGHGQGGQPSGEEVRGFEGLVQHHAEEGQGDQEYRNEISKGVLEEESSGKGSGMGKEPLQLSGQRARA